MPRFAILVHDHPFLHWDLLLETAAGGETLRTWRLLAEPDSAATIPAEPLPDHRRMYLDYEGPVGGERGHVVRWDAGTFETISAGETKFELELAGQRLKEVVVLSRQEDGSWRLRRSGRKDEG